MDPATLSNLVAYSIQIACVAGLAAIVPMVIRIDATDVRHAYWRAVTLLCLALPWLQARLPVSEPIAAAAARATGGPVASAVVSRAVTASTPVDWLSLAGVVLVCGVIARLSWMLLGVVRLRRMRRTGEPGSRDEAHDDLQTLVGARANIRYVDGLSQPVTFGLLHPVILLPASLRERSPEIQRAVLGHELLHVQRRDWAWLIVEEVVRAIFWFHPGVWFLISRIQLSREEVVDRLAVMLTNHKRTYAEALLAFADSRPVVLTAAFARRRHLFTRIQLISREDVMSSKRVVVSSVVMALAVVAGGWYAVAAFPMQQSTGATAVKDDEPGPLERRAQPITPENPVPRRVNYIAPLYPAEMAALSASGSTQLRLTLDEAGRVAEVRQIGFTLQRDDVRLAGTSKAGGIATGQVDPARAAGTGGQWIDSRPDRALLASMSSAAENAVRQWRYDPPFNAPITFSVTLNFGSATQTKAAAAPDQSFADGAIKAGSAIKPPEKTRHVPPVYPPIAMAAKVSGVVIIEVRIEPDGHVSRGRVLKSIPLLDQAALDAVHQWEFTPTLMNGQPVPIIATLTVNFQLE